jgi:hypothetical protein
MKPNGLLPCSQQPTSGIYPEPDKSILHPYILFINIHYPYPLISILFPHSFYFQHLIYNVTQNEQKSTSKFPLSDLFLLFTLVLLLVLSFKVLLVLLDGIKDVLLDILDAEDCDGNEARLWHLLNRHRRNSLCRWICSAVISFRDSMSNSSLVDYTYEEKNCQYIIIRKKAFNVKETVQL